MRLHPHGQRLLSIGIDRGHLARGWRIDGLDDVSQDPDITRAAQQAVANVEDRQAAVLLGTGYAQKTARRGIGEGGRIRARRRPQRSWRGVLHPARHRSVDHRWRLLLGSDDSAVRQHLHGAGADARHPAQRGHAQCWRVPQRRVVRLQGRVRS